MRLNLPSPLCLPLCSRQVWNPTVANLTLMALGSSAPEILLSLTDTIGAKKFYAGALGTVMREWGR